MIRIRISNTTLLSFPKQTITMEITLNLETQFSAGLEKIRIYLKKIKKSDFLNLNQDFVI